MWGDWDGWELCRNHPNRFYIFLQMWQKTCQCKPKPTPKHPKASSYIDAAVCPKWQNSWPMLSNALALSWGQSNSSNPGRSWAARTYRVHFAGLQTHLEILPNLRLLDVLERATSHRVTDRTRIQVNYVCLLRVIGQRALQIAPKGEMQVN